MYQKKSSEICLKERKTIFQKDEQRKGEARARCFEIRYVVNTEEQQRILHGCHNDPTAGHMGVKRTLKKINERLRWPGMVKDVTNMVGM